MADNNSIDFDKIEKQATKQVEENKIKEQKEQAEGKKPFANWTKGPIIIGGIILAVIIVALVIFLLV